jgi:O-antigen/teichoic acid export membrane protein
MKAIRGCLPPFLHGFWDRVNTSPIGSRLARGAFWSLAGVVISRAFALIASIICARKLGKETFGELGIIQSTIAMFTVIAGAGLGLTATKYIAELRQKDPVKAGEILALSETLALISGVLIGVFILIAAPWLAAKTLRNANLTDLLRICALMLFLSAFNGAQTGALMGFEAFKDIAKINAWTGMAGAILAVTGVVFWGIKGVAWSMVIVLSLNCWLCQRMIKNQMRLCAIPRAPRLLFRQWRILLTFSLPAAASGLLVTPVTWVCNTLLVNQPNGYAEMGVFNAANQWRNLILFIPSILGQIVLPILANLEGKGNRSSQWKILYANIAVTAAICLSAAAGISLLAPFIMHTYGSGYTTGNLSLILLSFSAVLTAIAAVIGQVIASSGKMWWGMLLNLIWGIAFIGSTWLLRSQGAYGLSLATLLAYVLHLFTLWAFIHFYLRKAHRNSDVTPSTSLNVD